MPLKLSIINRVFVLLAALWFAGYASATVVCANSCPECVSASASVSSCSASCSAVSVPSHEVVKVKLTKPPVQNLELPLIFVSVHTANIWKPPKQTVPSLLQLFI